MNEKCNSKHRDRRKGSLLFDIKSAEKHNYNAGIDTKDSFFRRQISGEHSSNVEIDAEASHFGASNQRKDNKLRHERRIPQPFIKLINSLFECSCLLKYEKSSILIEAYPSEEYFKQAQSEYFMSFKK